MACLQNRDQQVDSQLDLAPLSSALDDAAASGRFARAGIRPCCDLGDLISCRRSGWVPLAHLAVAGDMLKLWRAFFVPALDRYLLRCGLRWWLFDLAWHNRVNRPAGLLFRSEQKT